MSSAVRAAPPRAQRISRAAARVLYNVADAWIAPADGRPGGGDVDLVPTLETRLAGLRERLALEAIARALEWEPRLTLRSRRGFAWQPRAARRAQLERASRSRLAWRRRAVARLLALVAEAHREACGAPPAGAGPAPARDQSTGGA